MRKCTTALTLLLALSFPFDAAMSSAAVTPPLSPLDDTHPGSRAYQYQINRHDLAWQDRHIHVFLPRGHHAAPGVIFAKGQGAFLFAYEDLIAHLVGKGIAVIYVDYARHFFDEDYPRMARESVDQALMALSEFHEEIDARHLVWSGNSKGALVAFYALLDTRLPVQTAILFNTSDNQTPDVTHLNPEIAVTLVSGDHDRTTPAASSKRFYKMLPSRHKQFILVRSYTRTNPTYRATHGAFAARTWKGSNLSPLQFFSYWKFLTAAALDLDDGTPHDHPHLYGKEAVETAFPDLQNFILRSISSDSVSR